jgi:hypothetical protein
MWMSYNFPISQNPGYEFYRKGVYAHRQELEKQNSPLLKSPFLRGETSGQSALNLPVWPFRTVFCIAFATFATWFTFQSAFVIGAWCLWCTGIVTVVLTICAALTRIATNARAWGNGRTGSTMASAVAARGDIAVWVGWWLVIAGMLAVGLA